MKAGWEVKSLKDVCSILSGLWKGKKAPYQTATVIRNTNFSKDCRLDLEDVAVIEVEARQLAKRRLVPGDLILEKSGGGPKQPVGRVVYFDEPDGVYSFSNFTSVLRIKDPAAISPLYLQRYLFWQYMTGVTEGMERRSTGIRNLDMTSYMAIPVRYPPLPEQRRIVAILDEAFEGIAAAKANAERNLRNAREVFEARLANAFAEPPKEWASSTIGTTIRFIDYRGKTPTKTASGLRLITAKNVKMGRLLEEPAEYVAASTYKAWMTRGIPKKGDVLFTTEAPLANVAELDTDAKVVFAQRVIIMQPDSDVLHSPFVKYMLMSAPVQQRIHQQGTGATVKGIKSSLLKQIPIQFPKAMPEQRQIAEMLTTLEADSGGLRAASDRKLAALDELKTSLLHQAFTGQL